MSGEALLSIRDLRKHFAVKGGVFAREVERVHAVDGVSFDIAPGETLGPVVDLPQPDSPTRPKVSPGAISKLTPSTA